MRTTTNVLIAVTLCGGATSQDKPRKEATTESAVTAPPVELVKEWKLDPFYKKHVSAGGFPIVSGEKVSDFALLEARYLIDNMLDGREDIRKRLIVSKVRFAIMAVDEFTTAIPEHSGLEPAKYWDKRARGLGANWRRRAVSCGEENLLRYPGDPYKTENILIHEFAYAIHHMALVLLDKTFDRRLRKAYRSAMKKGLWKGKYAATNQAEYWAEGVQSWFDTNRPPDHDHNHVDTREELVEYDPALAKLIKELFGDKLWRYVRPSEREAKERQHLEGYDPKKAPHFRWPKKLSEWYREYMKKQREKKDDVDPVDT